MNSTEKQKLRLELQRQIVEWLDRQRVPWLLVNVGFNIASLLIVALPGGCTLWVTLKVHKERATSGEEVFGSNLRKFGHKWIVVRSLDEFLALAESPIERIIPPFTR